ncbi:DUF5605 domain-containing protein [Paenibacillus sp. NFR01]|uniref:DUF5605 domain-containing protein n=1 Tax=Paenibacillus sp. NFR01 TaxID=1566279 RepID=UPI0008D8C1E9|nr:DUF5605 domain-containing protein [Paenibacillus sp. NFR01]SET22722.1 protein of unknown function [Paenibacillus sp. NFR01]
MLANESSQVKAVLTVPEQVSKWDICELVLMGALVHGNPFTDVELSAEFTCGSRTVRTSGFYDGDGVYRIRLMPGVEGEWAFRVSSTDAALDGFEGSFVCTGAKAGNHGPVRVHNTFHFAYEDGTPYRPVGTTCYAWVHQGEEMERQTLESLKSAPFNKLRMCVFPKSYLYNTNEPEFYPFEGSLETGWDYSRFNPTFFRHLEERIADLAELGIEADLILFHPYDRWGFAAMTEEQDDRYLRYVAARLSAYRHLWWSLANEYDFMGTKTLADWERYAQIVTANDPYHHLISNHNGSVFYDFNKPWVTHCSIQRVDVYKTAENTDEWRKQWNKPVVIDECAYEGDAEYGWGNITGEEMVRRFWEGAVRGGYVGHGETYMHPEDKIWWAKGGSLYGTSPERIAFLRKVIEEGPADGLNLNPPRTEWDLPCAGIEDEYYLYYFGFNRPKFREFRMTPGVAYKVELLDTWNMNIEELPGRYEGNFRIDLPTRMYMAIRMTRITE